MMTFNGHRRRRAAAAVTALAVGSLLAACGSTTSNASGSGSGSSASSVPGITSNTITIGATEPITGKAATAGQGLEAGIKIATQYINAHGGVNGKKINAVILDDGFIQSREIANIRQLVSQDHVYAIVDPAGSQGIAGTWDFMKQAGTPMWGPISPSDPKLPNVYLLVASRTAQQEVAIDYFAKQGLTRIAAIGEDDDLGQSLKDALAQQVPKHPGMKVVANETLPVSTSDVSAAVLAVKNANPQALIISTNNTSVGLILKEMGNLGLHIPAYADQGAANTGGVGAVGPAGSAANGFLGGLQVDLPTSNTQAVQTWRAQAQQYSGPQGLSAFSLQTYMQEMAFVEVLKRMGSDYSWSNFEKTANGLASNPITLGALPPIACGPLPDGHTCGNQSEIAKFDATTQTWSVIQGFTAPQS